MKLLKAICCSTEGDLPNDEMMEKEKLKFQSLKHEWL